MKARIVLSGEDGTEGTVTRMSSPRPDDDAPRGRRYRPPARLVGAQTSIQKTRSIFLLTGATLLMSCLMFPPVNWGWLGFVCLCPWLVCVCTAGRAWRVYLATWLLGLAYFLINVRWMIPVTLPGYFAMCVYCSVFFPLAAWPIRHMHRQHHVSVALSTPIVWVATEYLRSIGAVGFPWLLLAHTQYRFLPIIQVSDLVGAYGVSFVLAMVNGWITDLLVQPLLIWRSDQITRWPLGSAALLVVLVGTLAYGVVRQSPRYFKVGPRVAVVQQDFPSYVDPDENTTPREAAFKAHLELVRQAAAEKPDLIVLPETAVSGYINEEFLRATPTELDEIRRRRLPPVYPASFMASIQRESRRDRDAVQAVSTRTAVPIVSGGLSMEWKPTSIPPRVEAFNSAYLFEPGWQRPAARYDKIHLVLFGEYVPFRDSYHWLYQWLNSITPWGRMGLEYSLTPGDDYRVFEFQAASLGKRRYRAGTPICYEEIIPYVARQFVSRGGSAREGKNIDLLLCISNDGWFLHSAELEQHLAAAVFRAVENRIPVARSVNTGCSAFVDPNGEIRGRVTLAPEKIARLAAVDSALRRLGDRADALDSRESVDASYLADWEALLEVFRTDVVSSLDALGAEFRFMAERLNGLFTELTARDGPRRDSAIRRLLAQVRSDRGAVDRWRRTPHTAPGYSITEIRCDSRVTLYSRWHDWFAQGTAALMAMMLVDWLLRRLRRRRAADADDGKRAR